jgi:hypothetical protein
MNGLVRSIFNQSGGGTKDLVCSNLLSVDLSVFKESSRIAVDTAGSSDYVRFFLVNSIFDFYHRNEPVKECAQNITSAIDLSLFFMTNYLILKKSVKYNRLVCPYLFKNAHFDRLEIYGQIDHFLKRNFLNFDSISEGYALNSNIAHVHIEGYQFELDSQILDKKVFELVKQIEIEGPMSRIQVDVFKSFKHCRSVLFLMVNYTNFFHKNGIE